MSRPEIIFRQPFLLALLLPALLLIAALARQALKRRQRQPAQVLAAAGLRVGAVVCAVLVLSGMAIITKKTEQAFILLVDRSDSMAMAREEVDRRLSDITGGLTEGTNWKVFGFAGEAWLEWDGERDLEGPGEGGTGGATDIAAALRLAMDEISADKLGRVILLTDGKATDGNLLSNANLLANRGVRLDAMLFSSTTQEPEVQALSLSLPQDTSLGQAFQLSLSLKANQASQGQVTIFEEDTPVHEAAVRIHEGTNTYSYTLAPTGAGIKTYRAEISSPADTVSENNTAWGVTQVQAQNRILIVQEREGSGLPLNSLLQGEGYETLLVTQEELPDTIAGLCRFSLIILLDADARVIGEKKARLLEEYVSVYGRSVLTGGGENTYVFGHMKDSDFEIFLPVSMTVEERSSKEPVALMLLMDNSASMSGTAIVMAKRGAIKSIESLNDNDYTGVITFSTEHEVLHALSGMENKDELITKVSGIGTMMGTVYTPALEEAYRQLSAFDKASIKHVIMMSDGNPSDSGYESIIQAMAREGITLSTIAVGLDISGENMIRMAQLGQGRCYIVTDSYDLPDIMMTDTILQQVDYVQEGNFSPTLHLPQYGVGTGTIPAVLGYVRVTAKRGADLVMSLDGGRPLYARWHYGSGAAGSFMSDLAGAWSKDWFGVKEGGILLNIVANLLPTEYSKTAYTATLKGGGKTALLTIEGADLSSSSRLSAALTSPAGETVEYPMTLDSQGLAKANIAIQGFGTYLINLKQQDEARNTTSQYKLAANLPWSSEYDVFSSAWQTNDLAMACASTGGVIFTDTLDLSGTVPEDAQMENDPVAYLALVALLCILLQVIIQKTNLLRVF